MQGLHRWIVEFALVVTAMAMAYEILVLFSGKRLWNIMAKLHIVGAAVLMYLAALSGVIDIKTAWMTAEGKQLMAFHKIFGLVLFFFIWLMANYRLLFQKLLSEKISYAYIGLGALSLGLLFGISQMGKIGVYRYGIGVNAAMLTHDSSVEYLKALYNLDELPVPTAEDSLRAAPLKPIPPDTTNMIFLDSIHGSSPINQEKTAHHLEPHGSDHH